MICPHTFDEPVGSGIPSLLDGRYWCMGWINLGLSARRRRCPEDCPFDTGDWGAWRSVVGDIRDCLAHATTIPYNETGPYTIHKPYELLAAVGWSP